MKNGFSSPRLSRVVVLTLCSLLVGARANAQPDPLPSWNDGAAKQAIVNFVQATTTQGNPSFVPPIVRRPMGLDHVERTVRVRVEDSA